MALISLPMKIPVTSTPLNITQQNTVSQSKLRPNFSNCSPLFQSKLHPATSAKSRHGIFRRRAVEEESKEEIRESEAEKETEDEVLGEEIKKAMMERKKNEEKEGLLSGVAEEIDEIEWPAFGKVLGTTGVVIGVIAGSSIVLLTVNAVLAELSDRVFAGRGVQDFFG